MILDEKGERSVVGGGGGCSLWGGAARRLDAVGRFQVISSAPLPLALTSSLTASLENPFERGAIARLGVCFHICGAERRGGVCGVFPFGETNLVVRYTFLETQEIRCGFSWFFLLIFSLFLISFSGIADGNNESRSWPCPVMSPICPPDLLTSTTT